MDDEKVLRVIASSLAGLNKFVAANFVVALLR
jgi:hypothetical protein